MRVDWQAYDAGLLSRDESEEVACYLASNAEARAEFQAFLAFKGQVRSAGLGESVPLASLREKVSLQEPTRRWGWPLGLAAAVLLLAAVLVPMALQRRVDPSDVQTLVVNDPVKATQFLKTNSRLDLHPLDPRPVAQIRSVACNQYWAKYKMTCSGKPVTLSLDVVKKPLLRAGMVKRHGVSFFVTRANGLATIFWQSGKFEFSLIGLREEAAWLLADHLWAQTSKWPTRKERGSRNGPMQGDQRID